MVTEGLCLHGHLDVGEEQLRGEVAVAWHRDRTATDAADAESPAHGPQARVWNGTDAYGQPSAARNWYAKLCLARWRQRVAKAARDAAQRLEGGNPSGVRAAADATAARAYSEAVTDRTRAARNLAFLCRCAEAGILANGNDCHGLSDGPAVPSEEQKLPPGCISIVEALRGEPPAAQGSPFKLDVTPRPKKRKDRSRGGTGSGHTRGRARTRPRANLGAARDRDRATPRRRLRVAPPGVKLASRAGT